MPASATIEFDELMAAVETFRQNISDATRAMPIIAESLVSHVQDVFTQQGAVPGHSKWPPLAPSTLKRRAAKAIAATKGKRGGKKLREAIRANPAGHVTILQDTGLLVGSISRASGDRFVEAYTNVPYAIYHVSEEPRKVIPLRDFFAIDERSFYSDAAETILSIVAKG